MIYTVAYNKHRNHEVIPMVLGKFKTMQEAWEYYKKLITDYPKMYSKKLFVQY